MGKTLVGLTKTSIWLEQTMQAAWKEIIIDVDPDDFKVDKKLLDMVIRRFDAAWDRAKQKRTPLKTAIMGQLGAGPLKTDELYKKIVEVEGEAPEDAELLDLSPKVYQKTIRDMLEGGLLTTNEREMWVLGPG